MTIRLAPSPLHTSRREKRPQKYVDFALQPGDEELLDLLPARQREILLTKGSYRDLAATLGVAVGTVRSRLHRARAALCALRQNHSEDFPKPPSPGDSTFN